MATAISSKGNSPQPHQSPRKAVSVGSRKIAINPIPIVVANVPTMELVWLLGFLLFLVSIEWTPQPMLPKMRLEIWEPIRLHTPQPQEGEDGGHTRSPPILRASAGLPLVVRLQILPIPHMSVVDNARAVIAQVVTLSLTQLFDAHVEPPFVCLAQPCASSAIGGGGWRGVPRRCNRLQTR